MVSELLRFLLLHFFPYKVFKTRAKDQRLLISLTTLHSRIHLIAPTLASLHDQSTQPKQIRLYVPKYTAEGHLYVLPAFLQRFPLLKVILVENDLGPGTKWWYVNNDHSIDEGTPLLVLDDDQVYPRDLVRNYLHWSLHKQNTVLTNCGWKVPETLNHSDRVIVKNGRIKLFEKFEPLGLPVSVDCVQGASSYLLPKGLFNCDSSVFGDDQPGRFADDILLSGILAEAGIPICVPPASYKYVRLQSRNKRPKDSLVLTHNANQVHNNRLYLEFSPHWQSQNMQY